MPDAWQWNTLEAVDPKRAGKGATRVSGAVYPVVRDLFKGDKPDWQHPVMGTELTVVLLDADHDAYIAAWVKETGKCQECGGSGEALVRATAEGCEWGPCKACGATGLAKGKQP
jgi:hypothetical protein